MVQRMLMSGGPGALRHRRFRAKAVFRSDALDVERHFGFGIVKEVSNDKNTPVSASRPRRLEDWSAQERLRIVVEEGRLGDREPRGAP
ncbi:hypothetical protein BH09MYX1_BH09MYX1_46020 [soil metagenome]